MNRRFLLAVPGILLSFSLVACAVKGAGEDSSSSTNAISASPGLIRSCSAASTYSADGPNDFDTPATNKLPASLRDGSDIVHFKAPVVGDVYASGAAGDVIMLFDVNGKRIAMGSGDTTNQIAWYDGNDVPLDCSSTPYNVHSYAGSSSSGWSSSGASSGWSSSGDPGSSSSGWSSSGTVWTDASAPTEEDGGTWSGDDDDSNTDGGVVVFEDAGH